MGRRNKQFASLSKAENKLVKDVAYGENDKFFPVTNGTGHFKQSVNRRSLGSRRTGLDTRLQSKTSNNSTWLHAVGFVVLAAIVISWALGY